MGLLALLPYVLTLYLLSTRATLKSPAAAGCGWYLRARGRSHATLHHSLLTLSSELFVEMMEYLAIDGIL